MFEKTLLWGVLFGILSLLPAVESPVATTPREVRVGYPRLEGFNEINPDRKKSGYGYEYLQRLALYTDFEYQYLGFDRSWDENLEMLAKGEIDLLLSAIKTGERLEKFAYSAKPIGTSAVNMKLFDAVRTKPVTAAKVKPLLAAYEARAAQ